MPGPTTLLKRALIFAHRWLGVALSLLFTLWFVSGIVMMYWSYPEVTSKDRLQRALTLTPAMVKLTPEQAWAALDSDGEPGNVRLTSFDGRPVYQFGGRGDSAMVAADDGAVAGEADDAMVDRVAAQWAGLPLTQAKKAEVTDIDQWIVAGPARNARLLYKYTFTDGQQVYVNGDTADVLQYTTTTSRFWAWLGAIPHWMYFTPLRKHGPQWFAFVVYSSLVGTIAALLGVIIAIWMFSPAQRYRYAGAPTSIPYRGWKRWHTIVGLCFGVFTTTWAFSGLLSMGPFPIVDRITELTTPAESDDRAPAIARALRGSGRLPLAAYASRRPAAALALASGVDVKELEFTQVGGKPVYMATGANGETRVIPVEGAARTAAFTPQEAIDIVRAAAGSGLAEVRVMDQYDAYYLDRHRASPLPVIYARMSDAASTRVYVDPKTGRVVGNYDSRNWITRWLYHGLHSMDFPWLYNYRPLWDIVVITLMLGGTAVCVTSLVLAYKVLARKVLALLKSTKPTTSDDLVAEG